MDQRTLPPGAFQNATFVGEDFKLAGLVEDILQLAPDTTNIAVVLGASPLERYWTVEFRRAFEPFKDRVRFTWFNDLTFDQMLERVAALPPRSLRRDDQRWKIRHGFAAQDSNGDAGRLHSLGFGLVQATADNPQT